MTGQGQPGRLLVVEPWLGGSHRSWAEGYTRSTRYAARLISHEAQNWRWRLQGSAVTLAAEIADDIAEQGPPDALLVSDLVDVAQLLGLLRTELSATPVVLYMHENQFEFPRDDAVDRDAAAHNWASMLAADLVMVNSEYHRRVIESGIAQFVAAAPDRRHERWVPEVLKKLVVIPVGVDTVSLIEADRPKRTGPPTILWNHRWDVDKQPDVFVRALERMRADGISFSVILAGDDAWTGGRAADAAARLGDVVRHIGHADAETYRSLLLQSDVCVSVANHEFFGIAIVEAMAAGCVPILPNRLSYPELVPVELHDAVLYSDGDFRKQLASVVTDIDAGRVASAGCREAMATFDWSVVAPLMDGHLDRIIRG